MKREIQNFVLRALLRAGRPMSDETLKLAVRSAFVHVALAEATLTNHLGDCKANDLIADAEDHVFGRTWTLTTQGRHAAQQLG